MAEAKYYLTILPETRQLETGIKQAADRASRGMTLNPKIDTSGASRAGQTAGREVQAGMDSQARGGMRRFLNTDGARSAGQMAGSEVNAGLQSANIGRGAASQLSSNLMAGASSIGRNVGSVIATGLKATAAIGGGALALGLGGALKAGMSRLTAIDDARFKLQGLGNDTQKVQSIMDNALEAVKGTAFGLDEAATTAASAVAAGITPGEKLTGYLKLTADTAAIAGTSLAEMGSIFNKVQTSGKAFTGDLNMLSDRGLPVFKWLQDEYKVTGEELSKMVSEGKVDAATFQGVIQEQIGGAAGDMGGSIRGQLSNLKAAYSRFGAELAGPLFAAVSPLTKAFTGAFDKITTAIKPYTAQLTAIIGPWATDLGNKITAWLDNGGVQKAIDFMGRLVDRVQALRTSEGRNDALSSIADSVRQIGPAMQQAGPALTEFGRVLAEIGPATVSGVLAPALNLLGGTLKFVADNASWAVPTIVALAVAYKALTAVGSTLGPFVGMLNGAFKIINTPMIALQTRAIQQQSIAMTQLTAAMTGNTIAQGSNTVAQNVNTATTVRGRIAAMASAVASRAAAAAQWLWNAALTANPIGLIIAGVVAAGVAIWAFFTKTETGRKMWAAIWGGIKAVAGAVWEWLKSTWSSVWEAIGPTLGRLGSLAGTAFSTMGNAIKSVWQFIQPAVAAFMRFSEALSRLGFNAVIAGFRLLGNVIGWLWTNVAVPAFQGIGAAASALWSVVGVVWDLFTAAVRLVGNAIEWWWRNVTVPAFEAIKGAVQAFWNFAKPIWDLLGAAFDTIGNRLNVVKDVFVAVFSKIKDVVKDAWAAVGGVFDKIGGFFDRVTGGINGAADWLGGLAGRADGGPVGPGYADGGPVRGPGTGRSDSILGFPAMVRVANGEFVVNARSTSKWLPILQAINSGRMPGFADGGMVGAGDLTDFARGVEGQPYKWGGVNWGDCSGAVSALANYATGRDPFGSRFATATEGAELANRGFKSGLGPPGSLQIGWYNGGPGGGHTAATLPDGTNFEMGGARGNGQFGGSAAGASDSQFTSHAHLPPEAFSGLDGGAPTIGGSYSGRGSSGGSGGGGSYRSATTAELASSSNKVDSARTSSKNADQSVDDAKYRVKKAEERLATAQSKGKGVDDAQHSLDVANRELADAQERQTKAHNKLTEAMDADGELRTKGKLDKSRSGKSGGDGGLNGSDLGKTFMSGIFESIGLDGSLFSNPLEWPTVKSLMAGINFAGGLLAGGESEGGGVSGGGGFAGGVAESTGLGGLFKALSPQGDQGFTAESGSPKLAPGEFNPAVSNGGGLSLAAGAADALSAFAPDTTQHGQGQGQAPGPIDNSITINNPQGEMPQPWRQQVHNEQNARTRTTQMH